jgi:uncharacterized metal-binding protein YceD (DUF177 family)
MDAADTAEPWSHPVRSADVAGRRAHSFALAPDDATRAQIARAVGARAVERLTFEGRLAPRGRADVALEGRLVARVRQSCVVTLAPVATEIDVPVERLFVAGWEEPGPGEVEMPEDDRIEPLPEAIDLGAVMVEALVLAMPDYPRAPGAVLAQTAFGPPGVAPMTDDDARPFAALKTLRPDAAD